MKRPLLFIGFLCSITLISLANQEIGKGPTIQFSCSKSNFIIEQNRSKKDRTDEKRELKSCMDVAMEILTTSPTVLEETYIRQL